MPPDRLAPTRRVLILSAGGTIGMTGDGGAQPDLDAEALVASTPGLRAVRRPRGAHDPQHAQRAPHRSPTSCRSAAQARDAAPPRHRRRRHPRHRHAGGDGDALRRPARRRRADRLHRRDPARDGAGRRRAGQPASTRSASRPARAAAGLGVLVVFGGEIHHARCVRKTDTTSLIAFSSPQTGPLGRVTEGHPTIWSRLPRNPPLDPPDLDRRVLIVPTTSGDDGTLARAALATEPDGADHRHARRRAPRPAGARAVGARPPSGSRSSPTAAPSAA